MTPIYFLHGKPRPGGVIRKGKKINIKHGPKPKVCLLLRPIFPPSRWCILLSPRRRDRDGTYNWRLVSCCSAFKVIRILLNGALEAIFFFTTLFCFPISTLARYCCRCKMRWAWSGVDWDGYDENPTPTKFLFFFFYVRHGYQSNVRSFEKFVPISFVIMYTALSPQKKTKNNIYGKTSFRNHSVRTSAKNFWILNITNHSCMFRLCRYYQTRATV